MIQQLYNYGFSPNGANVANFANYANFAKLANFAMCSQKIRQIREIQSKSDNKSNIYPGSSPNALFHLHKKASRSSQRFRALRFGPLEAPTALVFIRFGLWNLHLTSTRDPLPQHLVCTPQVFDIFSARLVLDLVCVRKLCQITAEIFVSITINPTPLSLQSFRRTRPRGFGLSFYKQMLFL